MLGHDDVVGDESFDRLVEMLDYSMFVVTTRADGDPSGCLVGFATQISIHPARFLAGVSKTNHTCPVAARSDYLAVHVLARRHIGLARLFGGQTGDQVDKFDQCSWHTGPQGMPILDDALHGSSARRCSASTAATTSTTRWNPSPGLSSSVRPVGRHCRSRRLRSQKALAR